MPVARLFLVFLFLGQDRFENVTRLGDMREVDFRRYALRSARRTSARMAGRAVSTLKMRAHLLRLIRLQ
jgi:hypothetical protein